MDSWTELGSAAELFEALDDGARKRLERVLDPQEGERLHELLEKEAGGGHRLLRGLIPEERLQSLRGNGLLGDIQGDGVLFDVMREAATGLRLVNTALLRSFLEMDEGGRSYADAEVLLSGLAEGSPFSHIADSLANGAIGGLTAVMLERAGFEEAAALIPDDHLVLAACTGIPDDHATMLAGMPRPWSLSGAGDVIRALISIEEEMGGLALVLTDSRPMALAAVCLGHEVCLLGDESAGMERALLYQCAPDMMGGRLVEPHPPETEEPSLEMVIESGIAGARLMLELAALKLSLAPPEAPLEYPHTAYGLPCFRAWQGIGEMTVTRARQMVSELAESLPEQGGLQEALQAGEASMYACEIIEALRYLQQPELADREGEGFIPDRVLRELGLSFVDDTIPGCALMIGEAPSPEHALAIARQCQSKGLVLISADRISDQLREAGAKTGWGRMLYPVGAHSAIVHAMSFALRAALSFGNVAPGDRERLSSYLERRPKVMVLQMGPLDPARASLAFAALMHKASIVSDQDLPRAPDMLETRKDPDAMFQKGLEMRGISVQASTVDIPVPYGPAFEGEVIRKAEMRIEAGGGRSLCGELLVARDEDEVEDGSVSLIGEDIDALPAGVAIPLAILVDVYGKAMEPDFEAVLERRIHQFLNYAEGLWHTGQRDMDWIRISEDAWKAGLRLRHIGEILVSKLKQEFGEIVSRVQVTLFTDEERAEGLLQEARDIYRQRDERMSGLRDGSVDVFYTCTLCQSFAPDHVCVISPERLGLCGAINWLDAKASNRISAHGPNQPIELGAVLDEEKGEWGGVNSIVTSLSNGKVSRVCMYSIMDAPMTSCGCFEAVVAMGSDMQSVVIVDREYGGMSPVGMRFSTLAGSIGGGRQTPGFMGVGRKYITSDKFLAAEGGLARVAWMSSGLKERLAEELRARAEAVGEPDLLDKIADETVCEDAAGLMEWMQRKGHPALGMPPLL